MLINKEAIDNMIIPSESNNRMYGIDFLRIIAMLMVVATHFLSHIVLETVDPFTVNWFLSWFLRALCYTSVTCYFLITSYFLIDKGFKLERIIRVCLEVEFYSILIFIITSSLRIVDFSWMGLLKALCPVLSRQYGFVNNYIVLVIASPFINILFEKATKKVITILALILCLICCVLPYIFQIDVFKTSYGEGFLWLLLLYTVAFIYKKHFLNFSKHKAIFYIGLGLLFVFIQFLIKLMISILTINIFGEILYSSVFYGETPLFSAIGSIFIFVGFSKMNFSKCFFNKIINFISPSVFAVYLIHENPNLRDWLWGIIGRYVSANDALVIVYLLLSVLIIFISCIFFDKLRYVLFQFTKLPEKTTHFLLHNKLSKCLLSKFEVHNG